MTDAERLDAIERRLADIADTLRVLLVTVRQQQSPEAAQRFAEAIVNAPVRWGITAFDPIPATGNSILVASQGDDYNGISSSPSG